MNEGRDENKSGLTLGGPCHQPSNLLPLSPTPEVVTLQRA